MDAVDEEADGEVSSLDSPLDSVAEDVLSIDSRRSEFTAIRARALAQESIEEGNEEDSDVSDVSDDV